MLYLSSRRSGIKLDIDQGMQATMKRSEASQFASAAAGTPQPQFAALCWRMRRDKPEVLLITSRDTGRWIIPKGWRVADCDESTSAAKEAWEEAGVLGHIATQPLGLYDYDKVLTPDMHLPCAVSVFALRVATLSRRFPERKERRRKWFTAAKAARKVAEPTLRALLEGVAAGTVALVTPDAT
jgi:8-oxo-dGTP pyrophosphatase MutT (NUDIX family)